jgi:hypothetical protein
MGGMSVLIEGMSVLAFWLAERPALLAAADEVAQRRPRVSGLGVLCCLAVVLLALAIFIVATRWRGRGGGRGGGGNGGQVR